VGDARDKHNGRTPWSASPIMPQLSLVETYFQQRDPAGEKGAV
jgi:hypothetical protein